MSSSTVDSGVWTERITARVCVKLPAADDLLGVTAERGNERRQQDVEEQPLFTS